MKSTFFKWRLIFETMPYAALVLILKLILIYVFQFQGLIEIQEIRIILTSGVFLTGFMLAGTLSDYKESERVPGRIASILEAIEEISHTLAVQGGVDMKAIRKEIYQNSKSIYDWFYNRIDQDTLHQRLSDFNTCIQQLNEGGGAPPILGRLHQYHFELRDILTRAHVISKTGFLATGYALLELLIFTISLLLILAEFQSLISEVFIIFFVELLYIYMYKLIRDIDDPFEYEEAHAADYDEAHLVMVSAEIPLFPLKQYIIRLEKRISEEN